MSPRQNTLRKVRARHRMYSIVYLEAKNGAGLSLRFIAQALIAGQVFW